MATKTNYLIWFSVLISLLSCVRSFLDIDEFKLATYGIDILRKPVTIGKDDPPGAVYLQSKFGQQYQCSFPDHSEKEKQKEEEEKLAVEIGIPELLRPLETGPCILKVKDWWTYEFCYAKHIRQYHAEDGKITGNIIYLGLFESEFNWNNEELSSKHTNYLNRYHSQQYVNGSKCDLTEEPRRSEVRFVCEEGSGDYISRIDEPETCVYIVTVHTTKICHHPNLKPAAHSQIVSIMCNPVISEEEYQQYLLEVKDEPDTEAEATKKVSAVQAKPRNPRVELHELIDKVMKMKDMDGDAGFEAHFHFGSDSEQPAQDASDTRVASSSETGSTQETGSMQETGSTQETGSMHETGSMQEAEDTLDTDVDEDLDNIDDEDLEGLTSMKEELRTMMESQVDDAIRQAEQEVGEDGAFQQEREATMKRLSQTVDKLLDRYTTNKKDIDQIEKELKEVNKKSVKSEDTDDVEEEEEDDEQTVAQTDKQSNTQQVTTKKSGQEPINNDRVKVKITRLKTEKSKATTDSNEKPIQQHVVETTIKDEQKETGLDTEGGKIRVKIITAGYSDNDDSTVRVLSEEDSAAFNKLIVEFLGGNQEAAKEAENHKELEENYNLVWGKNNKKSPSP